MAPTSSKRSLRIRTVDRQVSQRELDDLVQHTLFHPRSVDGQGRNVIKKSLTTHDTGSHITITFPTEDLKTKAMVALGGHAFEGAVDDKFDGITILSSPESSDIDICGVHGLGGNAMNTFQTSYAMWLRDLLPTTTPFQSARIMTFGYNSTLFDSHSQDRLQDWADYLLSNLEDVRSIYPTTGRPIIFVCHSLGGIVARKAMIRLKDLPTRWDGMALADCGLLFLSTPHGGSKEADYDDFLTSMLQAVAGLRKDAIVEELKSFNSASVDATQAFEYMPVVPPFECLCESLKTHIKGKGDVELVSQASAGFLGKVAYKIVNVDHHHICKYETKLDDGFRESLKRLKTLRNALLSRGIRVEEHQNV